VKPASLRPHLKFWALRGAWLLAIALWALALVPWFKTPPPVPVAVAPSTPRLAPAIASALPASSPLPEPLQVTQRPRSTSSDAASAAERKSTDGAPCAGPDAAGGAASDAAPTRAGDVARQTQLGLLQAIDSLRARGEPTAQGAGLWLRVLLGRDLAGDSGGACSGADCGNVTAPPAVPAAIEALAQLAQASTDPWLQQIAQRACSNAPATSAVCGNLGMRRWSMQEPDNAAAWLELANRDPQAVDEALYAAARASRFDGHRGRLAAWVLQAMPESVPIVQRHAAWQRADELERASDASVVATAARHCNDAARRDANRAQLCEGAARWLGGDARADTAPVAMNRALDCATLERQWREAREAALRGARIAVQAPGAQRP
jgi:hypothetical protein